MDMVKRYHPWLFDIGNWIFSGSILHPFCGSGCAAGVARQLENGEVSYGREEDIAKRYLKSKIEPESGLSFRILTPGF
jgi:hypothetical protein